MTKSPNILLIYTGGTIGMVKDYNTGALRTFNFDKLLEHIPEINHLKCTIESISFEVPIDSSNMNPKNWVTIAEIIETNYTKFDGFVVLHGSDTMSYTASAISFMFENREISWLSFNYRVLQEAKDLSNPLYERIKYLLYRKYTNLCKTIT